MKRYPKRVNDRKQYQEDELSDEDEYLCKEWQNEFHGYKWKFRQGSLMDKDVHTGIFS